LHCTYASQSNPVGVERLYCANEEHDDAIGSIGGSTKAAQTSNVHHKRNTMTPTMLLPWQHSWPQSLSVKNQMKGCMEKTLSDI